MCNIKDLTNERSCQFHYLLQLIATKASIPPTDAVRGACVLQRNLTFYTASVKLNVREGDIVPLLLKV